LACHQQHVPKVGLEERLAKDARRQVALRQMTNPFVQHAAPYSLTVNDLRVFDHHDVLVLDVDVCPWMRPRGSRVELCDALPPSPRETVHDETIASDAPSVAMRCVANIRLAAAGSPSPVSPRA
jgi:hypothetical protein